MRINKLSNLEPLPGLMGPGELTKPDLGIMPRTEKEALLEVRNLNVSYGNTRILHNVYCHFRANSVTAIMGPSGCGKSTLVNVLNRTFEFIQGAEINSGEILYHHEDIYGGEQNPMNTRKRIGMIYQKPIIFPMSILENVLFGPKFHNLFTHRNKREYAAYYLEKVGLLGELEDRLDDSANNLSGGQKQRLCLARTLANQPEVVLMDEPCSSLDPAAMRRIEELILDLSDDYTIIVVTHNMGQARRISNSAIFLFNGRIIEAGNTKDLFDNPRALLTRDFIDGNIG